MTEKLKKSLQYITDRTKYRPVIAIILGSGLGTFAELLEGTDKIETKSIPYYPASTVEGHAGFLVFGSHNGTPVLAVQGRTHFYEGYHIEEVTYVVRILYALGVRLLIVTNAAGAVNKTFRPGDLMLIIDHINYMFRNPLRGPLKFGGERFPDMSDSYDREYFPVVDEVALENGIAIKHGVLFAETGPSYETAAEIKMITAFGADAVSMSTVPEVIVAKQAGLKVIGISCITNMATGISIKPLNHQEVTQIAMQVREKFLNLLSGIINRIKQ
jgi:purine-nucleoside phosphorylase